MNRPDFDNMTEKEKRQFKAWINWFLGTEQEPKQEREQNEKL